MKPPETWLGNILAAAQTLASASNDTRVKDGAARCLDNAGTAPSTTSLLVRTDWRAATHGSQ